MKAVQQKPRSNGSLRRSPLIVYLIAVFTVSWLSGGTFYFAGGSWGSPAAQALVLLYTLPPGLLALAMHATLERSARAKTLEAIVPRTLETLGLRWRISPWWLAAWLIPVGVYAISVAVALALPGTSPAWTVDDFLKRFPSDDPRFETFHDDVLRYVHATGLHPVVRMIIPALLTGVTVNALRGLGEELGWRGFVHQELALPFFAEVCVVGPIWGLFYAPLVLQGLWYEDGRWSGLPMAMAWCTTASAMLLFVRRKSGGVFAPAILYGTLEAMSHVPPLTRGLGPFWEGLHGLSGIVGLAVVLGALLIFNHGAIVESEVPR